MRLNVLIGGKAGQGIKKTAEILSKALVRQGLYVFNYRYYQSLITGGHNFNVLCISNKQVRSFDREYDLAILLDENSLQVHRENFKDNCVRICDFEDRGKCERECHVCLDHSFGKAKNIYFSAVLFKMLGLDKKSLEKEVKEAFKGKDLLSKDLEAIEEAYKKEYNVDLGLEYKAGDEARYLTGNEAVGIGAIESGLDIYLAYPMTPATPLLTFLAQNKGHGYLTYQPENEIAVANASLGASFAGAKTMLGTSGGGFDLMTEALSMQGMTQLPLVCYLAMRGGPSSGAATYTSQQDLSMAINCGHGDFPRVVIAPGDIEESYKIAKEAFYLAEKYGLLSVILSDKHLAESGYSQAIDKYDLFKGKERKVPGEDFIKVNSYTHDEEGNYSEDADTIEKMANKREEKFNKAKGEIEEKFDMYKVYGDENSEKVVIGFGSTKGAILDSINSNQLEGYKYIHIIYLSPFSEKLVKELKEASEIFIVENNISGQLADLIQEKTGKVIDKENRILKYNARPFTPKEIKERLG